MAVVESPPTVLTITALAELFGDLPAWRIRNVPAPGTATEDDVLEIEQREDRLCELVNGVLVEKTVGYEESCLTVELITLINSFVKAHKLGKASGPNGMMRLFPGLVRIPDIAFTSSKRFSRRRGSRKLPDLVPDLAVEVLSEDNTAKEMSRKLDDYFDAGVRLVWFVDPRKRTAEVFSGKKSSKLLPEHETLTGGKVLSGFSLPLKELFADVEAAFPPARKKRSSR
ncbi:MAG TPA: Uma2 family endonuclease [Pirellulales bacterium]|jgi:Uma2 family endonuclease|nr:Uma2 family endonuclease [Pirellulales bacterium]